MVENIPLKQLRENTYNPRKHFDDARMKELEKSIKSQGVIQAITCRPLEELNEKEEEIYEVVAGTRRFKVCKNLGLKSIPAMILPLTDEEAKLLSITENLERADLTPMEEARSFADYLQWDEQDHFEGKRPRQAISAELQILADKLPMSMRTISNRLNLLHLPETIQISIDQKTLPITIGEVLTRLRELWKVYNDSGVPEAEIKAKIHEDMEYIAGQVESEDVARDRVNEYILKAKESQSRKESRLSSVQNKFNKIKEKLTAHVHSQELTEEIATDTLEKKYEWLKSKIDDKIKALSDETLKRISNLRANATAQSDRYLMNVNYVKELKLDSCPHCGAGVNLQHLQKRINELDEEIKGLNEEEKDTGSELKIHRASKKKLNALVREYVSQKHVLKEAKGI